jgi:Phage integrase family
MPDHKIETREEWQAARDDWGAETRAGTVVKPALTMHSLRHSHGSALIAAGWDIEEVSARLGHRDTITTARAYVHAYESARRSSARTARLEAMYGSDVEAPTGSEAQQTVDDLVAQSPAQSRDGAVRGRRRLGPGTVCKQELTASIPVGSIAAGLRTAQEAAPHRTDSAHRRPESPPPPHRAHFDRRRRAARS